MLPVRSVSMRNFHDHIQWSGLSQVCPALAITWYSIYNYESLWPHYQSQCYYHHTCSYYNWWINFSNSSHELRNLNQSRSPELHVGHLDAEIAWLKNPVARCQQPFVPGSTLPLHLLKSQRSLILLICQDSFPLNRLEQHFILFLNNFFKLCLYLN